LLDKYQDTLGSMRFPPIEKPALEADGLEDDELPFAFIPFLDSRGNQLVRVRIRRVVMEWVNLATLNNVDWEQIATTMSCSVVQEVDRLAASMRSKETARPESPLVRVPVESTQVPVESTQDPAIHRDKVPLENSQGQAARCDDGAASKHVQLPADQACEIVAPPMDVVANARVDPDNVSEISDESA